MEKIFLNNIYAYVSEWFTYPFICNCGNSTLEVYRQDEKIMLNCKNCKKELSIDNYLMKMMCEMFNHQIQTELRRRE